VKGSGLKMPTPKRNEIHPGMKVQIVEKQNQPTGLLTEGIVARILTKSPAHPHGIKVMLTNGKVGRVQAIVSMPDVV
jgi:uncharacterized repeat protein (TIGR03833 family)